MWGILGFVVFPVFLERFIPTHVGNTKGEAGGGNRTTVHPHACGEYKIKQFHPFGLLGSSPRMWGIPVDR